MHLEIKGVHYDVSETTKDYFDKKIERFAFARDYIIDLLFTITREKNAYKIEANINFRWGTSSHVRVDTFELYKGIEIIFDKIENKLLKEKEKIQEH